MSFIHEASKALLYLTFGTIVGIVGNIHATQEQETQRLQREIPVRYASQPYEQDIGRMYDELHQTAQSLEHLSTASVGLEQHVNVTRQHATEALYFADQLSRAPEKAIQEEAREIRTQIIAGLSALEREFTSQGIPPGVSPLLVAADDAATFIHRLKTWAAFPEYPVDCNAERIVTQCPLTSEHQYRFGSFSK